MRCNGFVAGVLLAFILVPGSGTVAQQADATAYGDPAFRTAAEAQLQKIYERTNGPGEHIEVFTRGNPLGLRGALGTEISGSLAQGSLIRIVGSAWTRQGEYSFEFYRDGGRLLMAYATFSWFSESAPRHSWRNFMGLAAWESRVYFGTGGEAGYAETRGPQAPPPDMSGKALQQQAARLIELLEQSPARWTRQ
jgi:hypothetical protein